MKKILIFIFIMPLGAYALTYKSILEESVNRHFDFQREIGNLQVSEAANSQAIARFLPSVSASISKNKDTVDNNLTEFQRNSIDANLNVFKFGADIKNKQAESKNLSAQKNKLIVQKFTLEKEISSSIFYFLEQNQNVVIYKKISELRKKSLEMAMARYKNGNLSLQDLQTVEIDFNNAQSNLVDSEIELNRSKQKLFEYTGYMQIDIDWPWIKSDLKKLYKNNEFDTETHPLNQFSNAYFEYSRLAKSSSFLEMLGKVDLSLSKGTNIYGNENISDDRFMIKLTLPLFSNFSEFYNYKIKNSDFIYANALRTFNQRKIQSQYQISKENIKLSHQTYIKRVQNLEIAEKLFSIKQLQFKKGAISVNELQLEQDRLLRSKLFTNLGVKQYHLSLVDYCHSIGKSVLDNCL